MKTLLYFHPHGSTSWSPVVDGVKDIAAKAGWHVQEVNVRPTHKNLDALCKFWNPIGVIVDAGAGVNELSEADLRQFPVVFIDHDPATLPRSAFSVCHDSAATATLAAKELLSTGFANFAYVAFHERRFWDDEQEAAFKKAIELNGKQCSVFRERKASSADSVSHLRKLRKFVVSLPKPCGVFAANDRTAENVLTVARMLNISIPSDLSVIGVDNYANVCENTSPTLTSVEPDFRRAGVSAAMTIPVRVFACLRRNALPQSDWAVDSRSHTGCAPRTREGAAAQPQPANQGNSRFLRVQERDGAVQVLPQQDGEDDVRLARQRIGRRHRAPLVEFLALVIVRVRLWRERRSKSAEAGKPCETKSASVRSVRRQFG